jgi:hypothetical protein
MAATISSFPLAELVKVRQSGVRSVNVEQDLRESTVAAGYLLTAQARTSLNRIIERFEGNSSTRAWTLTGPYGSGKSFFGVYLMNLFGGHLPSHDQAMSQLYRDDPILASRVQEMLRLQSSRGLLPVPITGYRTSIQQCLNEGLRQALLPHRGNESIRALLEDPIFVSADFDSRALIRWLRSLQEAITAPTLGYAGIVLVIDEMGKLLEYTAAHQDVEDIYLLQELAEFANRSGDTPVMLIGILHQSFDRYAGHLDGTTQREWSKVQGRFEDIAFQEPPHQQMRLIARAVEVSTTELPKQIGAMMEAYAHDALESGWRPPLMKQDEFSDLCVRAYPIHPTALVALPYLFRRLAQNERSMFAYLASHEPFGFQEFLRQSTAPATVRLADLFDYLAANFQGRLYASARARLITETLERLDNSPNLTPLAVELLKSIGLLNWLAEVSQLQANQNTLLAAMRAPDRSDAEILDTLQLLQKQSLIVHRRFNHTYAIWQGSDVDIEERMEQAHQQITGAYSLADAVQAALPPNPIVARRHSYQTGFVRYFEMRYVDILNLETLSLTRQAGSDGLVLLCLPANPGEMNIFVEWAHAQQAADLVIGVAQRTTRLAELVHETRCLQWVKDNTPELRDDPVARRELRVRLNTLESLLRNELDRTLSLHRLADANGCRWFYQGKDLSVEGARGISHLLSSVCDTLYPNSPRLWNEIINRRTLSSQGAAARRNLIEAMLLHADQPMLGIEGYPPERSMYESILKSGGLHIEVEPGKWGVVEPTADNPLGLHAMWQSIADTVFTEPPQPRSVQELFNKLKAPPFGLSDGVLPVLLCAFLLVHRDVTTLYSEGTLLPEPGIADWEVLLRRPELYAVAGCRVSGPRAAVVARLATGLQTDAATMPVVRELVRRLKTLPEHAWRTQRLAPPTLALRRSIEQARAPEQLLFVDLPQALDMPPFEIDASAADVAQQLETFFARLNGALQELAGVLQKTMLNARDILLNALKLPCNDEGWTHFIGQARELAPIIHQPQLTPLLQRAANAVDAPAALESVLAYISGRPPRLWTDLDQDRFVNQAKQIAALLQAQLNDHMPKPTLTEAQERRSRQLTADLRRYLAEKWDVDPIVAQAALSELLDELQRTASPVPHPKPVGEKRP